VRWQKIARLFIAAFVIVFAGVVFYSMRQRSATPPVAGEELHITDPAARMESGKGTSQTFKGNKVVTSVSFEQQRTYDDGKTKGIGITATLVDKDGRPVKVTANEAELVTPPGKSQELTVGKLTGNVRLATETGLEVASAEATYSDAEGMLRIPGPVEFKRGRMKGSGVGATYDRTRDVLWILEQAHITVAPDAAGSGAVEASAGTAGLARADNYLKLVKAARILSDGRTAEASEITAILDQAGEKIQQLQLRDESRISGTGPGAQLMTARHIDMTYAPDGRTLQSSKLMENGVVELPGTAGAPPRRIVGSTIDIGMSPDGATVTSLTAVDKVQVDLPAEGNTPGRTIRSSSLRATGAPGQGLQNAVFEGSVEFVEARPASGKTPAAERTARSLRLIVDTKPGLGPLERADFRGNAHFVDGQITADAPRALYGIDRDQLDLSPSDGDPGPGPIVVNPQLTVQARNIHVSPSTEKLTADTDVRSIIKPRKKNGDTAATRMPVMLKQDRPVTVTSNRLEYDGVAEATYSGNALLWQDQSRITADTIVLNDRTGNLTANENVRTTMMLTDEDPKTKVRKPTETRASSDLLVYDDAKRQATYTSSGPTLARLTNAQGDTTGKRIDLFLKENGSELERAEADGTVAVKLENLYATGKHAVYTAATDTHVMTGDPVVTIQRDEQGACKKTESNTLTYQRSVGSIRTEGMPGLANTTSKPLDACPAELRH
jgi:lipopolysaccharide export system protein LptA